ncbi:hypothetical protein EDD17DRAFT_1614903 [Pisolithus thermaeus]|nr:hypothetical protein EDD17DRAFT_1614903 [Pisolithus thermaeus]
MLSTSTLVLCRFINLLYLHSYTACRMRFGHLSGTLEGMGCTCCAADRLRDMGLAGSQREGSVTQKVFLCLGCDEHFDNRQSVEFGPLKSFRGRGVHSKNIFCPRTFILWAMKVCVHLDHDT